MRNRKVLALILSLFSLFMAVTETHAVKSRIEWPVQTRLLATNELPMVITGVPFGFLGATFQIEQFDPRTTILKGFIVLTNQTDLTNKVTLCLNNGSISYHMELIDMEGNVLLDPNGSLYNWNPGIYEFAPYEAKRYPIKLRLRDYFDIKPGQCQLLFVFDERMIRKVEHNGYAKKPWAVERIILRCDPSDESSSVKNRTTP
jgi:hypothetical protein